MKSKLKKILILFIGLIIAFSLNNTLIDNKGERAVNVLKESAGYSESSIYIDGTATGVGAHNWTWAKSQPWCYGDGSWSTPYIIENVSIDASTSPTGSGILIENSQNAYFIIRNCTIYNSGTGADDAGIKFVSVTNAVIFNNTCYNNGNDGILLMTGCINNTIVDNFANNNGDSGIYLENNCYENTILNNTVNNNDIGIILIGKSSIGCDHNDIINNTAINNGVGIWLSQSDFNTLYGNILYNNSKITFDLTAGNGIRITYYDWGGQSINNVIENNQISYCRYGIFMYDGVSNKILNNTINNNTLDGMYVRAKNVPWMNNTIKNNTISYNQQHGIYLRNSDSNNIINNTVNENNQHGIYLSFSDSNDIINNTVNENNQHGIYLSISDSNDIINNTVNENNQHGIYLSSSDSNDIINNTVNENNQYGIYLSISNSNNIINNTINDNTEIGIVLSYSDYNNITDNTLKDNALCLFETQCTGNLIENNDCSGSTLQAPIVIDGFATGVGAHNWTWAIDQPWCYGDGSWSTPYIIENLEINGFGIARGIFIKNSNVSFVIQECLIYNSYEGIFLDHVNNSRLINNNCSNNDEGIYLYDCSNNTISGNTASYNDEGIYLITDSKWNNITKNIVNDNSLIGIYLYHNCDNNTIKNNTINRNNLGIGLYQSNYNNITENILIDNEYCIYEYNCIGNLNESNYCTGSTLQAPISIDDLPGSANDWAWARTQPWCTQGTGSLGDPYIIENLEINGFGIVRGISIKNSNVSFVIQECLIYNSYEGIFLDHVNNSRLINNNCSNNWEGIYLYYCSNNTISGNTANYNSYGIDLYDCSNNTISGNTANYNDEGIYLYDCSNNTISGNTANYNYEGIHLYDDCSNNTISGNTANYNDEGIYLDNYCSNNTISGNTANYNHGGIYLDSDCSNNTISGNTASYNDEGIYLDNYSSNNTIKGNKVSNNIVSGIFMEEDSDYNEISENIIYNNTIGIDIDSLNYNNTIYGNFFLINGKHAVDNGANNDWNSTTIGNYWDNHTGPDVSPNDGIVDIPYTFIGGSAGMIDYLPIAEDGAPSVTINSPSDDDVFGSIAPSYDVTITDDYLFEMWYTLDGGLHNYTFTEFTGTINQSMWDALSDDVITLTFYASDIPGNIGSADVNIIKDTQTPTITVNSPEDDDIFGSSAPSFNVRITDDNIDTMWYTLDGGLHNYTFTDNGTINPTAWTALLDGPVEIIFYANDTLGRLVSAEVNVIKDTQTPAITVNSPEDDDIFGSSAPSFNVRITDDNIDSMWYTLDGGLHNYTFTDNGTINPTPWAALLDGPVEIIFYANDTLGRLASAGVNIVKDATGPIIVITSPVDDEEFGTQAPLFNITITDDHLDSIWYSLDGGVTTYAITTNATIDQTAWAALSEGTITITFYANDTLGHETSEDVIITKSIPPAGDDPTIVIVIIVVSIVGGVAVLAGVYLFMKKRGITE